MSLVGFDASGNQDDATFAAWLAKADLVIYKATEGKGMKVATWKDRVATIRAKGLLFGGYGMAWPENGWAADLANYISVADLRPGERGFLDFEPWPKKQPLADPKTFPGYIVGWADGFKAHYGMDPGLYIPDYFISIVKQYATAAQWARIIGLRFWKPGKGGVYVSSPDAGAGDTFDFGRIDIWQWTDTPLDQNVFYGTAADWRALGVPSTSSTPAPAPAPAPAPSPTPTGGTTVGNCVTTSWQGSNKNSPAVKVCSHSVPRLNAWAAAIGNDVLLKPLAGCGSYQTSTAASAGTHAGGGAIDMDLNNLTYEQKRRVETKGRQYYGMAYYRWAITGLWTNHCHAIDPTCPNISKAGAAQFPLFKQGYDALVGNHPDTGDRTFVSQIMAAFAARLLGGIGGIGTAIGNAARVKMLQKAVGVYVDGVWGTQTEAALAKVRAAKAPAATVKAIQDGLGAVVDGVWGPQTDTKYLALRALMYKPSVSPAAPAPKPIDTSFPYQTSSGWYPYPGKQGASYYGPSRSNTPWYSGKVAGGRNQGLSATGGLTQGWIQGHIKRIQKCVGTTVDGSYGTATVAAVSKWQKAHGVTADGIVGPRTWAAMAKSRGQGK